MNGCAPLRGVTSTALLALCLFQCVSVFGWGNEGHEYVNRVAAEKIPVEMPRFLRHSVAELTYLGPEPDRWRSPSEYALKNAQEPDHYIDLERVAWLDPLPPGRYEFYRKLYEKRAATSDHPDDYLPEHVGLQPYITMEIFGRLTAAFREYRHLREQHQPTSPVEHAIVFYAGWLGHYVADGSQPLHTTIHYNGWVGPNPKGYTTQHGIHAAFESAYVAQNVTAKDFAKLVRSPERLGDRLQATSITSRNRTGRSKLFIRSRKRVVSPVRVPPKPLNLQLAGWQPAPRCCWTFGTRPGSTARPARRPHRLQPQLRPASRHFPLCSDCG